MVAASNRDILNLRREDLLEDYFDRIKLQSGALAASALRTRSIRMRDIFLHKAIHPNLTSEELKNQILTAKCIQPHDVADVEALAELGRVALLQNLEAMDDVYGEKLLSTAVKLDPEGRRASVQSRRVLVEHHLVNGNYKRAIELLNQYSDIDRLSFGYLRAETLNPFKVDGEANGDEWLAAFNRAFTHYGLTPVELTTDENLRPFDRLKPSASIPANRHAFETPFVSVVLTAYQPDRNRLLTSVRSVLDQTWHNLELIIVDDCSGPGYNEVFQSIEQLDERISVIHASANRGTYVARNIGYAASSGDFITGQDDDDWSHPERIERQVDFMRDNADAIGCRVSAIRCDENLGRVRVGSLPYGQNASSLLIRRAVYHKAGNYLSARKAADSEYHYRVEKVTGRKVATLREPLSIIRILEGSLSRGDFGPGWKHSSRRSFRSAYEYWHNNSDTNELYVSGQVTPQVEIPRRFRVENDSEIVPKFDVIFVSNWEQSGWHQEAMLEEISALSRANYRVGIMNLESGRYVRAAIQESLNDQIQQLINIGTVEEVFYDEEIDVRLLILRHPSILQFITHEPSNLNIHSMIVVADESPSKNDGSAIRYRVEDCHVNAENSFGVSPMWIPQDSKIRLFLENCLTQENLAEFHMPRIIDVEKRWHHRLSFRSTTPVVGRYSSDEIMKWPSDRGTLEEIYPTDGRFDIRIMGGIKTPTEVLERNQAPAAWTVYGAKELTISEFLNSLDYFVFYDNAQAVDDSGQAILEALASGTVVILPKGFETVFGDAAIYADSKDVYEVIMEYHSDFSIYQSQLKRSREVLMSHFSYGSYTEFIQSILKNQRV